MSLLLIAACGEPEAGDANTSPGSAGGKADDADGDTSEPLPGEGESCDDWDELCNDGLYCHEAACTAFEPAAAPWLTGEFTPPSYFTEDGRDDLSGQTGIFGMHVGMLPSGRVLLFAGRGFASSNYPMVSLTWDPLTEEFEKQAYDDDVFCAHHTFLPNGDFLVAGGGFLPNSVLKHRATWRFDSRNETWTQVASMDERRWYPSLLTLPDGRALVASGTSGADPLEIFDPDTNRWTTLEDSEKSFPERYPAMRVLPNGRIYSPRIGWDHGDEAVLLSLDENDVATWQDAAGPNAFHENGDVTFHVDDTVQPARAVMRAYAGGIVDARGLDSACGSDHPDPECSEGEAPENNIVEQVDLTRAGDEALRWESLAPMGNSRANVSVVMLPDGKAWAVGGQTGGQWNDEEEDDDFVIDYIYETELYDPKTDVWTVTKALMHPRQYHHTATLLPDGRVLVTGGQDPTRAGKLLGGKERDIRSFEIYSPPYLFDEDGAPRQRPSIPSEASRATYGETFELPVTLADAQAITRVVMISPNSETHHTATGRFIELGFERITDDALAVTAPSTNTVATPGFYMLFVVDAAGTPSVAKFVQVTQE
ncbi:MAG: DUF1929 domain-containing protein [Nannocystaceae bacterium]|nr:DUF1929 domain-containing protein [Nannocystaceae bacterium]